MATCFALNSRNSGGADHKFIILSFRSQNIDLKICMYDRLYQDQIIVHNRWSQCRSHNVHVASDQADPIPVTDSIR